MTLWFAAAKTYLILDQIAEYAYNLNTGARALQTVVSDIENTILKELEANRKKGGEHDLLITPEIMQKATSRYEVKQEEKGAISKWNLNIMKI